jgi:hypothetical protein
MSARRSYLGRTAATTVALCALFAPAPGRACGTGTPAYGVDQLFWGGLRPTDVGQVPFARDSTDYHGQTRPDWRYPLFSGIDLEGTWAFTSYSTGFKIWSIAPPTAQLDPQEVGGKDGWKDDFLVWDQGNLEIRERIFDIDVPDGHGNLAAMVGIGPMGMAVWNTTTKANPSQRYQDTGITARDVYTATIGGRHYAFAAAHDSLGNGIQLYDLTTAAALSGPCAENHNVAVVCAAGADPVYKGRIGANQWAIHLEGLAHGNGKHYLAASAQLAVKGVELWDVTNPLAPVNLRSGGGRFLATSAVHGVALWEEGGSTYLALQRLVVAAVFGEIYDVTGCLGGGCTSLGAPLWASPVALLGTGTYRFTTFSRGGSTPYLYFGVEDMCSGGLQREHLYDVTDAADPQELGAGGSVLDWPNEGGFPDPYPTDYWSWYYDGNPTGYSFVMPRRGRVKDGYFYRAAWTLFDVHEIAGPGPEIVFADGFESGDVSAWSAAVP